MKKTDETFCLGLPFSITKLHKGVLDELCIELKKCRLADLQSAHMHPVPPTLPTRAAQLFHCRLLSDVTSLGLQIRMKVYYPSSTVLTLRPIHTDTGSGALVHHNTTVGDISCKYIHAEFPHLSNENIPPLNMCG